ncbi:MAG: peptidylprolyl isomerase [Chitinophagaceae bacterium]|nr:MAG: peptidylprolyl isomerase [Chitinophagaceae bacterium]
MSLIQKIRDKYARIAVIAIGLALLGFILMDAFAGRGSVMGGNDTTLGKINGKKIEYDEFNRKVSEYSKRQGQNGENATQQIVNGLWQQEVNDVIMGEQYKELGITVTSKELDQLLYGANPSPMVLQAFGNPQSWDPNVVRQQFTQISKSGTVEQKAQLNELIEAVEKQALMDKYLALLTNSVYIPKWFLEKRNVDNSQMATAAYVGVPYTSIADSTVKVSDDEINAYVKAHQKDFEQKEESRSISYVQFSAAPSSADSAAVRNQLLAVKDSFQSTNNVKEFLLQNRSIIPYNDLWFSKADLPFQNTDTILGTPNGIVAGPFVEQTSQPTYLLTKILDRKSQPDTAKVRHILVGTVDPATGTPTRDTVAAKAKADSIMRVITAGASFDSLVKLSDDQGKVINNGVYDSITRNAQLVQEFKDFALNNPVGTKGVVKTQFGYHYMEVLNQRGNSQVYKVAFFGLPIEASNETVTEANNAATMFAGSVSDEKSFNDYFEKNLKPKGYNKLTAANLRPMDYNLTGVNASARELIKEVFNAERGDVLDPKSIANSYIVAVVTDVQKAGLPSASAVRTMIEPVLVNKKKAEQIKKQMGTVADLNAVASKFNQQVQTADSLRFSGSGPLGYETKVLGAVFNPSNKGKTVAEGIPGQMGVYAIRVDNTFTGAVENAGIEQQRQMLEMQARQQMPAPVQVLEKKADIKDYRAKFY